MFFLITVYKVEFYLDVTSKFNNRETITNKSASIMVNLKKEVEETHWKILFAAEHLIDLRLKSISTFLGQFYQDTNGEKGWIVSQQFHSYKRLCKIIETYNKALR